MILILLVTRRTIAENHADAFQIKKPLEIAGHAATFGPHVQFTNFRVPVRNLLAAPGKAVDPVEQGFTASAVLVGAMSVSVMRAAVEAVLRFAENDSRGGSKPII